MLRCAQLAATKLVPELGDLRYEERLMECGSPSDKEVNMIVKCLSY